MWYYNFQYPNFIVLNKKNERFSTIELSFVRGNEYIECSRFFFLNRIFHAESYNEALEKY